MPYKNVEDRRKHDKKYAERYKERRSALDKSQRRRETKKRSKAKAKLDALNAYGGPMCVCCGETMVRGLTIDHIKGNGAEHRKEIGHKGGGMYPWLKRNGYPPGYQVLCFTCNIAKGTGDHCPHKDIDADLNDDQYKWEGSHA